jgi:hypothetical protein
MKAIPALELETWTAALPPSAVFRVLGKGSVSSMLLFVLGRARSVRFEQAEAD